MNHRNRETIYNSPHNSKNLTTKQTNTYQLKYKPINQQKITEIRIEYESKRFEYELPECVIEM